MPSEVATADFGEKWPPGFRFHPTDEELVVYYLKRKICSRKLKLDVIREIDVYKWDPEELPGLSILKTGDRQWFFFSPRDRKYPNGSRSNRATRHGYWKATGKDRTVTCNSRTVGIKKTLVFYKGRAPSGERTDWVMHEYILDESELKRCEDVQSYYVLYKVFKKSGPGPKNGEQYGALFREEDWADNELTELGNYTESADVHKEEPLVQWDDIEEFMKQLVDEPELEAHIDDFQCAVPQVFGLEGAQSITTETSYGKSEDFDLGSILPSYSQQIVGDSLDVALPATSQVHLPDAYELTSTGVTNLEQHVSEEDFLEMDDLLGPEITHDVGGVMPQPDSSQWGEVGGLCELDFYYDAEMFLRELGSVGQATAGEMVNMNDSEGRQPYYAIQTVGMQQQTSTLDEPNQEAVPFSASGDECGGNLTFSNENQNGKGVEGDDKWYTSGLWSFVESIPTTPASAAESALVNRAFERMSSFTRLRMNLKTTTAAIAAEAATSRSTGGRMKGLFVLSLMGALLAILFVFGGGFGRITTPREYV